MEGPGLALLRLWFLRQPGVTLVTTSCSVIILVFEKLAWFVDDLIFYITAILLSLFIYGCGYPEAEQSVFTCVRGYHV